MNPRTLLLLGTVASLAPLPSIQAANLDRATFTEVVNRVSIIEPSSKRASAARLQQSFASPNVLRTGSDSRAEMIAPDQAVTRVGQNTLFSFEPNSREIQLQRGSILFQSSNGKGGGTIRTPAASAAVLGTTLIVTTTANGGFKVLVVEGKGRVKSGNTTRSLRAGEMVYALPGGKLSGILEYRLSQQVAAARLVNGFARPLPSLLKIQAAIGKQEKDIASGRATGTNLLASGSPDYAFRVDVARDTLAQNLRSNPETRFDVAESSDAVVDSPSLDRSRLFSDAQPNRSDARGHFTANFGRAHAGDAQTRRSAFFLANNIRFETPEVHFDELAEVDLFQFLAIQNIHFAGSSDFTDFDGEELQLLAGRAFTAASDPELNVDAPQFTMLALGGSHPLDDAWPKGLGDLSDKFPLELDDLTIRNPGGNISMIAGALKLGRVSLDAAGSVRLTGARNLSIAGRPGVEVALPLNLEASQPPDSLTQVRAGREVQIESLGDARIQRAIIAAPTVRATSDRVLALTAVQLSDESIPAQIQPARVPRPTERTGGVFLYGKDLADLRRVNFFANDVLIQSHTVRLEEVRFRRGSRVILESAFGRLANRPNLNSPVEPGKVNFINNVHYGDRPAQHFIIQHGDSNGPPFNNGVGIVIRSLRDR